MSTDLPAFLAARYDEAEALAKAAFGDTGTWWRRRTQMYLNSADPVPVGHLYEGTPQAGDPDDDDETFAATVVIYDEGSPTDAEFAHIEATDPKHRLADVALKRAILTEHAPFLDMYDDLRCKSCMAERHEENFFTRYPCATVRQLGTEFASHPEYRETWRP